MNVDLDIIEELWKTNREKVRQPKRGHGYCFGCDAAWTSDGRKCPVCGKRHGVEREKVHAR